MDDKGNDPPAFSTALPQGGYASTNEDEYRVQGYVHSVETAGAVDGPGLRFVVFLSGCPLQCLYCHNPDARVARGGRLKSAYAIVDECARYKDFLMASHGGITLSGGEPLFQEEFATDIFRRCKALGIHTALDTSGYKGNAVSAELLAVTDLVLLDIKHFNPEAYKRLTGFDLAPTLDFARKLQALNKPVWLRYVLVPRLTDDLDAIRDLASFVSTMKNVERIEVLPFHKMGEEKWKKRGLSYTLAATPEPSAQDVEKVRQIFRDTSAVSRVV